VAVLHVRQQVLGLGMASDPHGPFDEPLKIVWVEGEVVVLGPGHMHGAFTVEAAEVSAARLAQIAEAARVGEDDTGESG